MGWTFSWLQTWQDIWAPAHVERWRRMVARPDAHATPFMHPDHVRAWLRSSGGDAAFAPYFLHAEHASGQQALWLFVRLDAGWRHGYVRRLVPIGASLRPIRSGGTLFDYQEPVVAPARRSPAPALEDGFWRGLERELAGRAGRWFDVCAFPRVRTGILEAPGRGAPSGVAPYVRLGPYADFPAYLAARKPSVRHTIRRRLRRIAAAGEVDFAVHDASDREMLLEEWLPAFEAAHRKRHARTPLTTPYLRNLVNAGLDSGLVCCSSLSLDGRTIGWAIAFYLGDVYYAYNQNFDEAYAHLSPGMIHMAKVVEWVFGRGGRTIDLLAGDEAYKADWTDGETFHIRGLTLRSSAPASTVRRAAARGLREFQLLRGAGSAGRRVGDRTPSGAA